MSYTLTDPDFGSCSITLPSTRNPLIRPGDAVADPGHVLVFCVPRGAEYQVPRIGDRVTFTAPYIRGMGRHGVYLWADLAVRVVWVDEGDTNERPSFPCYWVTASDTIATA